MTPVASIIFFFFFNDTATTEIYTLSLHDALPISLLSKAWGVTLPLVLLVLDVHPLRRLGRGGGLRTVLAEKVPYFVLALGDRKSTRLNSSHLVISYAVFCLKKKKIILLVRSVQTS